METALCSRELVGTRYFGGVPTPIPELANLLIAWKWSTFFKQVSKWAIVKRKPAISLVRQAIEPFLIPLEGRKTIAPSWISKAFLERNRSTFEASNGRLRVLGAQPSFQLNLRTMEALRRQIALNTPLAKVPCEWSYPYLDRDLLAFLFAVPPEQILRPGNRRSLMKRALAGIVPLEVLERKRKGFVEREPALNGRSMATALMPEINSLSLVNVGIVEARGLREDLQSMVSGNPIPFHPLIRLIALENWLRGAEQLLRVSPTPTLINPEHLGRDDCEQERR